MAVPPGRAAEEEGEEIDINRIQQQLWERDGQEVSVATIKEVLIKLSRGDLIDYRVFGNWFGKSADPILKGVRHPLQLPQKYHLKLLPRFTRLFLLYSQIKQQLSHPLVLL